jgi:rubrerythrin
MSKMFFNDVEAVKIACNMEANGLAFYQKMVARTQDQAVKRVFEQLAEDEKEHKAAFEQLQQKLLDQPRKDSYLDDEMLDAYMQRLVETHVFADQSAVARIAAEAATDLDALAAAMRAERDTMLFYQEMAGFTESSDARAAFQRIIGEERRHLVLLAERSEHCENLRG